MMATMRGRMPWLLLGLAGLAGAEGLICGRAALGGAGVGLALLALAPVVWGAFSGLELSLSLALGAGALALLLHEVSAGERPRLRGSLVLAALLPWARPELSLLAGAGVIWLG